MERTEKAYFKKYGFRMADKGAAQLTLFDIIDQQLCAKAEYDKQATEKKFEDAGFGNYPIARNKLYDSLMQTLREHGRKRFPSDRIFNAIREAHVLGSKGLDYQANKLLRHTIVQAKKQNQPILEQLLLKELNAIAIKSGAHQQIVSTIDAQIAAMERAKQMALLAKYYEQVHEILRKHGVLNGSQTLALAQLKKIENDVKQMRTEGFLPSTLFNFYMLNQVIAFTRFDKPKALQFTERAFRITQSDPEIFRSRKSMAASMLSSLIQDSLSIRDLSYYNRYIKVLKNLDCTDAEMLRLRESRVLKVALLHRFYTAHFGGHQNFWKQFQKLETAFNPDNRLSLCADTAHFAFANGDYRLTIRVINHLLDLTRLLPRTDIVNNTEVLLILSHYELQNYDTVDLLITALKKRQQAQKDLSKTSLDMIELVRKINGLNDEKQTNDLFRTFTNNHQTHYEKQAATTFNVLVWVKSKLNAESYQKSLCKFFDLPIA